MRESHRTSAADAILAQGFRDGEGTYLTAYVWRGVWASDMPLDENEGAAGNAVLVIEIPDEVFASHEWVKDVSFGYREALIPAPILNACPRRRWTEAEGDAWIDPRFR